MRDTPTQLTPDDVVAFTAHALEEARLGPGSLRRLLRENSAQVRRRDAQGRTLYMQMLDLTGEVLFETRVVRNMAAVVVVGKWRWLCGGSDAQGRGLWPHLLRAMKHKTGRSSARRLALATRAAGVDIAVDRGGRGLVEQVLLHPDDTPWKMNGWPLFDDMLATIGGECPCVDTWLPPISDATREALMDALTGPDGRFAVDFMVDVGVFFHPQAGVVPEAWRGLFFNAALLLVGGVHPQAHPEDDVRAAAANGRGWIAADTPVHEKVRDRFAAMGDIQGRWGLELARAMMTESDILVETRPRQDRLLGEVAAPGRRRRA